MTDRDDPQGSQREPSRPTGDEQPGGAPTEDVGRAESQLGDEGTPRFTADVEESARLADARQRREHVARELEGRAATDARSQLARSTVGRRADEIRGLAEIEEAERIILEEPIPEQLTPSAERRGARQVVGWFLLSAAATIAFLVIYVLTDVHTQLRSQNALFGLTLGIALLGVGIAAVVWVKKVMPHDEAVQMREHLHPADEERRSVELDWARGVEESGVTRRKALLGGLGISTGLLPLIPLFMLRDLGPSPTGATGRSLLTYTAWRKDMRFVEYDTLQPVKIGDLDVGSLLTILPEGHPDSAADSAVMLIRMQPQIVDMKAFDDYAAKWKGSSYTGSDFVVSGHVAFSKICTHAGCPVSLYQRQIAQFLCPCHQSTFVAPEAGKVVFGPAARALPMLPFYVDDQGYFRAKGDFPEPVGPSFWERG